MWPGRADADDKPLAARGSAGPRHGLSQVKGLIPIRSQDWEPCPKCCHFALARAFPLLRTMPQLSLPIATSRNPASKPISDEPFHKAFPTSTPGLTSQATEHSWSLFLLCAIPPLEPNVTIARPGGLWHSDCVCGKDLTVISSEFPVSEGQGSGDAVPRVPGVTAWYPVTTFQTTKAGIDPA